MNIPATPSVRLLALPDAHGAPLVDFDWYESLDLLHVLWHGHLTPDGLVRGTQAGMELPTFQHRPLPRRILTNHQHASGSWDEASPWLHYDWLPRATTRGLNLLAHLISHDSPGRLSSSPEQQEFFVALNQSCRTRSFRHLPLAWFWLTRR